MEQITDFQRNNLKKLATFLEMNYSILNFDMYDYFHRKGAYCGKPQTFKLECGAIACAVGHSPTAGIRTIPADRSWNDYACRVFTNDITNIWLFLFSNIWTYYDNTALGAAARIRYFLDHENNVDDYCEERNPRLYESYLKPKMEFIKSNIEEKVLEEV